MLEQPEPHVSAGARLERPALDLATTAEAQIHIQSYWRFRDLLEAAPDAIIEVERDGTIVLLNAATERIFGYKRDELLGQYI